MSVSRSGFYSWKSRIENPSPKELQRLENIHLFTSYHKTYPSHGYRWLNTKIKLDTGMCFSDNYAHRCCKFAGIHSKSKRYRYVVQKINHVFFLIYYLARLPLKDLFKL